MKRFIAVLFFLASTAITSRAQWVQQTVNTTADFRGLSVVNEKTIWASGTGSTVIRTTDGGETWKVMTVPGADKLDFRDIEAFDANNAYILSIGNGESSRIYKTTDGGATWDLQFTNKDEKAFFDAIACWDKKNCIAMSDPVDGRFLLIATTNGGESWTRIVSRDLPVAKDGEAAFAASGTCLYIAPRGMVYLVTGGKDARVFRSDDRGSTWIVADTPVVRGTAGSGIFSIAFRDERLGIAVGGNYEKPDVTVNIFALTRDGGKTFYSGSGLTGYRSGVTYVDDRTLIAVGTNGTDVSNDGGKTWTNAGRENLNSVAAKGKKVVWAVGPKGLVVKLK